MTTRVASALAQSLFESEGQVTLIWHCGEPLLAGHSRFLQLLSAFEGLRSIGKLRHAIQTNATLIDHGWCEIFRDYAFVVGVSIDGPAHLNIDRVDHANHQAFTSTMRGIDCLREQAIPFNALAVATERTFPHAREIYEFFCAIQCSTLGINIVERESAYLKEVPDNDAVSLFWAELFDAWRDNPVIEVREISQALSWIANPSAGSSSDPIIRELMPTISVDGDIVLLSPEFLGYDAAVHRPFVVGNVFENSLWNIHAHASGIPYVAEFAEGMAQCHSKCPYFSFCGGGQASNKYFELGTLRGTETAHCRNSKIRLAEAILNAI
jgi:uncharacterized protein